MSAHVLLNGIPFEESNPLERACQYGDGLFETIAVRDGRPCLWSRHMLRLQSGCERLGLPSIPPDTLLREAVSLCGNRERAVLKIIISAGPSGRGYTRASSANATRWLGISNWPEGEPWSDDRPLAVEECSVRLGTQPLLAGIKHLNRLEQVLARRELRKGVHEGVVADQSGRPVEGIMSNLLLRYDDRYLTPVLDDAGVAGTVRQLVIDNRRMLGRPLEIATLTRDSLYDAEALFMTNALIGIRPVATLGGHRYPVIQRPAELEPLHAACFDPSGEIG